MTLDLGRVESLAAVALKGVDLGVRWKAPFAVDVTPALRAGKNRLEVKVVNVWRNRLIADAGLPESKRVAWVTSNPYKPTDRLAPSDPLGPVQLRASGKQSRRIDASLAVSHHLLSGRPSRTFRAMILETTGVFMPRPR